MQNKTAQNILQELKNKYQVSDEMIAIKVSKCMTAVWRWRNGKSNPSATELKLLERILRRYQKANGK